MVQKTGESLNKLKPQPNLSKGGPSRKKRKDWDYQNQNHRISELIKMANPTW